MADFILTFTIPAAKKEEYISDYVYRNKNRETIPDPDLDPEIAALSPLLPKYTDEEWMRQHLLNHIRQQVMKGKERKNKDNLPTSSKADDIT